MQADSLKTMAEVKRILDVLAMERMTGRIELELNQGGVMSLYAREKKL